MNEHQTEISRLSIWTKKFAGPFQRLFGTQIQKVTASIHDELVLHVYKPGDDKTCVVLSIKTGDSGISTNLEKPQSLQKPNSIVQIARKYIQLRRVEAVYASFTPICIVIECGPIAPSPKLTDDEVKELNEGPDCIILDLDARPVRCVIAKKFDSIPERYQKECSNPLFSSSFPFYESWCEWTSALTKTKRRMLFSDPLIGYCPFTFEPIKPVQETTSAEQKQSPAPPAFSFLPHIISTGALLDLLPTHVRRLCKTKLNFLERRITKQKEDLPSEKELTRLKKQAEGLKTYLYLWPQDSLIWYVPPQLIEEYSLNPIYKISKGEKPGSVLNEIFENIDVQNRRKNELNIRIAESQKANQDFKQKILNTTNQIRDYLDQYVKDHNIRLSSIDKNAYLKIIKSAPLPELNELCNYLGIKLNENPKEEKKKKEEDKRRPYRSFISANNDEIRVSKSALDADSMIKLMPSNHFWIHVLEGEGSHVWIKKSKSEGQVNAATLREAYILAVHYSKHTKTMSALVQMALRSDIEKKKNLPPGKVLVRRSETVSVNYDKQDLKQIFERNS